MDRSSYEADVVLWSRDQAAALRAGDFSRLDIEHLAGEIEDVGISQERELSSRMADLLAHLLKWLHQPERRGRSWSNTIDHRRARVQRALRKTPSLKVMLVDPDWIADSWDDAVAQAAKETGLDVDFGTACPWPMNQVLTTGWLPD